VDRKEEVSKFAIPTTHGTSYRRLSITLFYSSPHSPRLITRIAALPSQINDMNSCTDGTFPSLLWKEWLIISFSTQFGVHRVSDCILHDFSSLVVFLFYIHVCQIQICCCLINNDIKLNINNLIIKKIDQRLLVCEIHSIEKCLKYKLQNEVFYTTNLTRCTSRSARIEGRSVRFISLSARSQTLSLHKPGRVCLYIMLCTNLLHHGLFVGIWFSSIWALCVTYRLH
jgi:hypothetical protein